MGDTFECESEKYENKAVSETDDYSDKDSGLVFLLIDISAQLDLVDIPKPLSIGLKRMHLRQPWPGD